MKNPNIVFFGQKAFCITSAKWDTTKQIGIIKFEDDNGISYSTESLGMAISEQRTAVFDAIKRAWINTNASAIAQTANKMNDVLKSLAIDCGNHPYEDGE